MLVTLEEAKLYLKVDGDEDNALISSFISTSEELCENILRFPLSEFVTTPESVRQAALYCIANLYEKREDLNMKEVIGVMIGLLSPYRKDGW
ncbi:MAG: head-tail connector protein [Youngiibacter sp.]|nr:head-tail connector protein [Youngiibacter sp.]